MRTTSRISQENIYIQRVNAVIDYVRENLREDLPLETLARVAGFSPFHFHRLFKSLTNETVNELVLRLRLERAATLLRSTPEMTITRAAFASGFKSVAVFSRAFKKHYGINAQGWDRQGPLKNSKNGQVIAGFTRYTPEYLVSFTRQDQFKVRIRSLPPQRLAYIRVYDAYNRFRQVKNAYYRILEWYRGRGGSLEATTLYGMSQDDPDVTPLHLCRFDWCLAVPADWKPEGEVGMQDFPPCRIAAIRCRGDIRQEDQAIQYLFRYWLPHSRYQPANLPGMEIYLRQPLDLGWKTFDLECAVPVEPL